jgi:hypothetical protein
MIHREFSVLPRLEPGVGAWLRGHLLAAAAVESACWPPFLDILLATAAPGSWGGSEVLQPLWVDEAMHRTRCMVHLTLRLERQMMQRKNRAAWSVSCLGNAVALADSLAELEIVDDREVLPCSRLLSQTVGRLLHLFRLPDGEVAARITVEDIAVAAYRRRALILATVAVVMQAIANAMDCGCAPAISIKLAGRGGGHWCLAVTEDDVRADDSARDCDNIVDGLSDLLAAQNVRRFHRMGQFVTEIDFPGLEARPSVPPQAFPVSRAAASTFAGQLVQIAFH